MRGLVFVALATSACGRVAKDAADADSDADSDTDSGSDGVAEQAACEANARAWCDKLETCWPGVFRSFYGDADACLERSQIGCVEDFRLPGQGQTPETLDLCSAAVTRTDCYDILEERVIPECVVEGTLDVGEACALSSQCKSARCEITAWPCGMCADPLPAENEPCTPDGRCGPSLYCGSDVVCHMRGDDFEACDAVAYCLPSLNCVAGACAPPAHVAEACDPNWPDGHSAPWCLDQEGLACLDDGTGTGFTCHAIDYVEAGEACAGAPAEPAVCAALGFCDPTDAGAVCEPAAGDGQACDDEAGPHCQSGAGCTLGVCTRIDRSACAGNGT